ncbi:class I SAM-dependent methyltransferase [Saccharopolyspora sp. K220]|uniref:SAM-dependent methyltransferase n=1 Tax=Saccharopolyspora soli TaxID=2926618 RepID=UPI001F5993C6|nr:class I SAM-dependent methyltransferase [Saccharopolyspora soli]MCI2421255.1 class I SAM-dependent methyltransferase [Saccharopolyspora soli]
MAEPEFDTEGLFDDDYLYFYSELTDARNAEDTELIWNLLRLEPGTELLDLACGHGRLANPLAARGCRVTGLDYTQVFLDKARADAETLGVQVEYVRGDMRELPWTGRFDAVINWFTAFGYFSDEGNRRVLEQVHNALRPGGKFALELNNVVNLLRRYQDSVVRQVGEDMAIDQHRLDPITFRSIVERTIIRDGRIRRVPYSVRFFAFPELRDWLHQAGFREVEGYGADGAPLTAEHRRMIVIAER